MSGLENLKVVDFHVHIGLKEHWNDWVHEYQKAVKSDLYERYDELTNPQNFAEYLAGWGIEKAVILPEINPSITGVVPNEFVLDFCQENEIYAPFCTVNPSIDADFLPKIKKYIRMGARGIKLYPSYNHFFPNDKKIYPVYELAQEHGLPVLIHTGSSVFKGSKIKYANPLHLDEVAADFPGCSLLMAHG
ncbi:MAG: amidohydrolase family protein, partial [Candidatus Aminicenantes bacterium]